VKTNPSPLRLSIQSTICRRKRNAAAARASGAITRPISKMRDGEVRFAERLLAPSSCALDKVAMTRPANPLPVSD
jgi:hypothetical protein